MRKLFLIPARGGSKGIPRKNIKLLNNKPLICHTIDKVRQIMQEEDILCVSTDDEEIKEVVEKYGCDVPFLRPESLAQDNSGSYEVILHALYFYEQRGIEFDCIVLLQATTPFASVRSIQNAIECMNIQTDDAVISAFETKSNPYYVLFEENREGYLEKSKKGNFLRRQDIPKVYELNGAAYVLKVESIKKYDNILAFPRIKKYEMPEIESLDLDTPRDWDYCEFLIEKGYINL